MMKSLFYLLSALLLLVFAQLYAVGSSDVYNLASLRKIIQDAHKNNTHVIVQGARHSAPDHTYSQRNQVLNLSNFNEIQKISEDVIRVQAGATWKQVLEFLNPHGLSVGIMQSDYDFSVGGTLSTNVHGWQANKPPIISSVVSFHLLCADGVLRNCSRSENPELFAGVMGGYGLLGIIIDVDLRVVPNNLYELKQWIVEYKEFSKIFDQHVPNNSQARMFFGRFMLDHENFLKNIVVRVYGDTGMKAPIETLSEHAWAQPFLRWIFALTYQNNFFKNLRWFMENNTLVKGFISTLSRNQLLYHSVDNYISQDDETLDELQEYFVPLEKFEEFVTFLQSLEEDLSDSLMNVTVRYVRKDKESCLHYATQDMFCFVMFFRGDGHSKKLYVDLERIAPKITKKALELGGTYYLPYSPFQTKEQFRRAYPNYSTFVKIKRQYDPSCVFYSNFYKTYFQE